MPSIGHVVVGLSAGSWRAGRGPRLAPAVAFTALATFPDLDVLAHGLGAPYGSAWVHRGALHSLAAAAAAALVVGLLLEGRRLRASTLLVAFATAASHGLLDSFTHGGEGVMLLWPFSHARWLAPWSLMAASPMGVRLFSLRAIALMGQELVLFSPLIAAAAWWTVRGRRRGADGDPRRERPAHAEVVEGPP